MEFLLLPLLILGGLFASQDGGDDNSEGDPERENGTEGADRAEVVGRTVFFADAGDDVVTASGNATVYGGAGEDQLSVGDDDYEATSTDPLQLYGGAGNDALTSALGGLASNTYLSGDEGDDFLLSHLSGDTLVGGDGADHLVGLVGSQMSGGAGQDILQVHVPVRGSAEGEMVITDYNAAEDQIGISLPTGHWLETMEITTEEVEGSTRVSFAFDADAPAFPMGLDNDALDLAAPENFSILLEGVSDFDPTAIRFLTGINSESVIDTLDSFIVETATAGDDVIVNDNAAPTYIFAGAGDDTISAEFRGTVVAGDGDDIVMHQLIAQPLDEVNDDTSTMIDSWTFGGAGSDLIVLEDDFIPYSIYDSGEHNIGGFEMGQDRLGLLLPSAEAGDVEVTFGTHAFSGFVTVDILHAGETLTVVLHGITEAPGPGFVELYQNEAAVLAGTPYSTV